MMLMTLAAVRDVLASAPPVAHASSDLSTIFLFFLVLLLATFLGLGIIRRVSPLLHTPLMSLTNAISAIAVVGAIIVAGGADYPLGVRVLGALALFCSMTNIISGFLITNRMIKMFKTEPRQQSGNSASPAPGSHGGRA
jgi:NAD(P) transhydrogenase subunit alpha